MFYVTMAGVESEHAQKVGVVGLVYNVGTHPFIDRVGVWQGARLMKSLPLRWNAVHYCYNNPVLRSLISFGMMIIGEELRPRVRPHSGK